MDELTLMWQSAPVRRSQEQAVPENWFSQVPDLPVTIGVNHTEVHQDDAGDVPLERLEAQICSLAGRLAASTCEWLRLIAEFDRRKGWAQWGVVSCAHWLSWACSVGVCVLKAVLGLPVGVRSG